MTAVTFCLEKYYLQVMVGLCKLESMSEWAETPKALHLEDKLLPQSLFIISFTVNYLDCKPVKTGSSLLYMDYCGRELQDQ